MIKGILAIIGASLLFGVIPTIQKQIMLSGATPGGVIFFTFLCSCIYSLAVIVWKKTPLRIGKKQLFQLIAVGLVGMGMTNFFLISAYNYIPVGLATMLHFMYPTIVCISMAVLFSEKLTIQKIAAIAASVLGMALIADLGGSISFKGIIMAVLSGATYSYYIIANDKGSINALPLIVKLFYVSLSAILSGLQACFTGGFTLPSGGLVWFYILVLNGIGFSAALFLVTVGVKAIGASKTAFINMLEPISSLIISTAVYHYRILPRTAAGCALIMFSVFMIVLDGWKNRIRNHESPDAYSQNQ